MHASLLALCFLAGCSAGDDGIKLGEETGEPVPDDSGTPCTRVTLYTDGDGDGFGNAQSPVETCAGAAGVVADDTDCNDANPAVHPGAAETCGDGDDDDCDGRADTSAAAAAWYGDDDGDGYGDPAVSEVSCDPPAGWVADATDCRPEDGTAFPGAAEQCNSADDDCDGSVDEDFERDGDGHVASECGGDDCDDTDPDASPDAVEICDDGVDNDCDGSDASCTYEGTFDLGTDDVKIWSSSANYDAGRLIETGDVDADGFEDLVVPTWYANGYSGGGYVIYGPVAESGTLEALGVRIRGEASTYGAGRSVGVGDVNGDGYDDVQLGAPDDTAKAWILFGPIESDVDLVDGDIYMWGDTESELGHGADLADISGDGVADIVMGAYEDATGGYAAGTVFLEYGPVAAGDYHLEDVADARLIGDVAYAYAGRYIRAGKDVDGDGVGDILAATPYSSEAHPYGGGAHLVHGGVMGDLSLADSDAWFAGEAAYDYAGEELALGDVNGDGLADVILGSYNGLGCGRQCGTVYVVYGPADGDHDLADADILVRGSMPQQQFGLGLDSRDVDGDGVDELLVGALGDSTSGSGAGAAYLFFGPIGAGLVATDADASFLAESPGDQAGEGVAISDLDADGMGEIVVGAPAEGTGGVGAGAVYVRYPSP